MSNLFMCGFERLSSTYQKFIWDVANLAGDVTYLGACADYLPLEISRRGIAQSSSVDRGALRVTMPRTAGLVREFRRTPPSPYWLTLPVRALWRFRREAIFAVAGDGSRAARGEPARAERQWVETSDSDFDSAKELRRWRIYSRLVGSD